MTIQESYESLHVGWIAENTVKRFSYEEFLTLLDNKILMPGVHIGLFPSRSNSCQVEEVEITDTYSEEIPRFENDFTAGIKTKTSDGNLYFHYSCLAFHEVLGFGFVYVEQDDDVGADDDFCRLHCVEDCSNCERVCPCRDCGCKPKECDSFDDCENLECTCEEPDFCRLHCKGFCAECDERCPCKDCEGEFENGDCEDCSVLVCTCDAGDGREFVRINPRTDSVYDIADVISEAAKRKIVLNVVPSIGKDPYQGQAEWDGTTVTLGQGLINMLSDGETAGIIAHETAHLEKIAERNRLTLEKNKTSSEESFRDLIEICKAPPGISGTQRVLRAAVITVGATVVVAGSVVVSRAMSRKEEAEADLRAVEILQKAGYDPRELANALEKMSYRESSGTGLLGAVLATHPTISTRVGKIDEKIDSMKKTSGR